MPPDLAWFEEDLDSNERVLGWEWVTCGDCFDADDTRRIWRRLGISMLIQAIGSGAISG